MNAMRKVYFSLILCTFALMQGGCMSDENAALRDLEKGIAQGDTYRKSFLEDMAAIRGKFDAADSDSL